MRIWVIIAVLSAMASPGRAEPVLEVDGRVWTDQQLLGCSLADLRREFDEDAGRLSATELAELAAFVRPGQQSAAPASMAREAQAERAWRGASAMLFRGIGAVLSEAAVTDRLESGLDLRLSDHFAIAALRDATQRRMGLCRDLRDAWQQGRWTDKALWSTLRQRYQATAQTLPPTPSTYGKLRLYARWAKAVCSDPTLLDREVRGCLAMDIVRPSLEAGVYHRLAQTELRKGPAYHYLLDVRNWEASEDLLWGLAATCVKDGVWQPQQRAALLDALADKGRLSLCLTTERDTTEIIAAGLGGDQLACASIGLGSTRFAAVSEDFVSDGHRPPADQVTVSIRARHLAQARWGVQAAAHIPALRDEWAGTEYHGLSGISGPPSSVRVAAYQLRPVPVELFDQYEAGQAEYQDTAAALARAGLSGSAQQVQVVRQRVQRLASEAPALWRKRYAALLSARM